MSIAAKCDCGQPFTYCVGNRFCPKIKEEPLPITQRTYSEQDLLDTWDAATNRFFDDQYGKVPTCSPSKSEFFKQKFGIEIK